MGARLEQIDLHQKPSKSMKISAYIKKIYAKMMFFDVFLELIRLDFDGF
jgi:hypothetical protein